MSKQMIEANKRINEFLQDSLRIETELEARGNYELARTVRRTSSLVAEFCIKISGLDKVMKAFWDDKKQMAENIN